MEDNNIFSPSDYSYVMNDLKDCSNLEDVSVGQLLDQVYNPGEPGTYESDQSEAKPVIKKRKSSRVCDSTVKPSTSNVEELPCLNEYPGQFDFQLYLPNEASAPHRWTFSKSLKKIFIDIEKVLALQFKWLYSELKPDVQLYVRALPVYTSPDWLAEPVTRCPLHILPDNATNLGFMYVEHIIRCEHSSTRYEKDDYSGRLSCVTPLSYPQPGSETTTLTYKFVCKTSCPSGMDRKPISVIFTLEDINGTVFGRQPLAVKICSCPKRDKAKEEQSIESEKKVTRNPRVNASGGNLSVRASKVPNNEGLKDIQSYDTEGSSDGSKKLAKKIPIAHKKLANAEVLDAIKDLKEEVRNCYKSGRNVDSCQSFCDSIGAQLRELPPQVMYELQAEIQRLISNRKSAVIYDQQMMAMNQCVTPAPMPASEYRNWH